MTSPLFWTFEEVRKVEHTPLKVAFFDKDSKLHHGALENERFSTGVTTEDGETFSWNTYGYNDVTFYNPANPDFELALRAAEAKSTVAALYYSSSENLVNPDVLAHVEAIRAILGDEAIALSKKRLRACGAGSNKPSLVVRMAEAIKKKRAMGK